MNEVELLAPLLHDVHGNLLLGNDRKVAGYLKSLSLMAGALSRQYEQKFELDLIKEPRRMAPSNETAEGLESKRKLNQREVELCDIEVMLAHYFICVSCDGFVTSKAAAEFMRNLANDIEALGETELFRKPATFEEIMAWAAKAGFKDVDGSAAAAQLLFVNELKPIAGSAAAVQLPVDIQEKSPTRQVVRRGSRHARRA